MFAALTSFDLHPQRLHVGEAHPALRRHPAAGTQHHVGEQLVTLVLFVTVVVLGHEVLVTCQQHTQGPL